MFMKKKKNSQQNTNQVFASSTLTVRISVIHVKKKTIFERYGSWPRLSYGIIIQRLWNIVPVIESNRGPPHQKSRALPTELPRLTRRRRGKRSKRRKMMMMMIRKRKGRRKRRKRRRRRKRRK